MGWINAKSTPSLTKLLIGEASIKISQVYAKHVVVRMRALRARRAEAVPVKAWIKNLRYFSSRSGVGVGTGTF